MKLAPETLSPFVAKADQFKYIVTGDTWDWKSDSNHHNRAGREAQKVS
jgi:hypothetical protein